MRAVNVGSVIGSRLGREEKHSTSLSAFTSWLALHPVDADQRWSGAGVRYQVARYFDYLTNLLPGGDARLVMARWLARWRRRVERTA